MRTKTILVVSILLFLLLPGIQSMIFAEPTVEHITTFSDDSSEKIINFPSSGGGFDNTASFELPKKAVVTNASFNVSTEYNSAGNYPNRPFIDVGGNKDYEWAFDGRGYGDFGKQNVFNNNDFNQNVEFKENITYNTTVKIKLPKNATIYSTSMKISSYTGIDTSKNHAKTGTPSASKPGSQAPKCWNDGTLTGQNGWVSCNGFGNDKSWMEYTWKNNVTIAAFRIYNCWPSGTRQLIGCKDIEYWNGTGYKSLGGYNARTDGIYTLGKPYTKNLTKIVQTTRLRLYNLIGYAYPSGQFSNPSVSEWEVYPGSMGGSDNVSVDIGNNGIIEFNITGELNGSKEITNFTNELNTLISSSPVTFTDDFGIEFVEIKINITNNKTGFVLLSDLNIQYNLTTKVLKNPYTGNLRNELNELIPDTGEGNITIPLTIYSGSAGKLNITDILIQYYVPELTNDILELQNGHGPNNICYADYENYTFVVNITNKAGKDDVKDVTLTLDPDGEKIKVKWSQNSMTFSEVYDPFDYIVLNKANCISTPLGPDRWHLEFDIRFTFAYFNETLEQCELNTTNDTGAWVLNYFEDVYRVENDLNFIGKLSVTSQYQGTLSSGNWVRANELITWKDLTVVYDGTSNIFPHNKNFNITITDDDNGKWINSKSSGGPFSLQTQVDTLTDTSDVHNIKITDIPGAGQDNSKITFTIRVDADGPLVPSNIICHADSPSDPETIFDDDTTIYISWDSASDQSGSGVDYYTMEYNNNLPLEEKVSGDTADGVEGDSTFYVRAKDRVGNWGTVGSASIIIDLTDLTYSQSSPDPEAWQNSLTVECGIQISDIGGSGIQADSIQFRSVESGSIQQGSWQTYHGPQSGEIINCKINITFQEDGADKKVQWRALDLAGNGYIESSIHIFKIDSTPVNFDISSIDFNKWYNTLQPEIALYINDTNPFGGDCSGVDTSSITYSYSTTGMDNFGAWETLSTTGSEISVQGSLSIKFKEGDQNYIRFKAKDIAGNEIISEDHQLKLDVTNPAFLNPTPDGVTWLNQTRLQCNITLSDEFSKVDAESVRYSIKKNGTEEYLSWRKISLKHLSEYQFYQITLSCNDTFVEGENNFIRWRVSDVAGNTIISDDFRLLIDITDCTFHQPEPASNIWFNTETIECSIIINDTLGSGVDVDSIEYAVSSKTTNNQIEWMSTGLKIEQLSEPDGPSYSVKSTVKVNIFSNGVNNFIYWRAKDLAQNGYVTVGPYQIQIDQLPVELFDPTPVPEVMYYELEQACRITAKDLGGSGVDPNTIECRYSTSGAEGYTLWSDEGISIINNGNDFDFMKYITFEPGNENLIQWRIKDLAGNGPYNSDEYALLFNSPPIIKITSPIYGEEFIKDTQITFDAQGTFDPDFDDELTFYWVSNISNAIGYTDVFKTKLVPGQHLITIHVFDGHNHNESLSFNITIKRPDYDNDGIPDFYDPDIDDDGVLNKEDVFPYDETEWIDTDFDGIGNNADPDDDDDGHLDHQDKYPLDKSKYKDDEEPFLGTGSSGVLIVIIVVVLVILFLIFGYLRKRAKNREATATAAEGQFDKNAAGVQPLTQTPTPPQPTFGQPMPMQTPMQMTLPMQMPMPMQQQPFQQFQQFQPIQPQTYPAVLPPMMFPPQPMPMQPMPMQHQYQPQQQPVQYPQQPMLMPGTPMQQPQNKQQQQY